MHPVNFKVKSWKIATEKEAATSQMGWLSTASTSYVKIRVSSEKWKRDKEFISLGRLWHFTCKCYGFIQCVTKVGVITFEYFYCRAVQGGLRPAEAICSLFLKFICSIAAYALADILHAFFICRCFFVINWRQYSFMRCFIWILFYASTQGALKGEEKLLP